MTQPAAPPGGPLWAQVGEDDGETLPLWKAALVAVALEFLVPLLVFGVDWSFLPSWEETPTPVISVRLDEPPPPPPPPAEKPKPKQREKPIKQVPVELPKPLPDEAPPKIALAKPEEKKPEPKRKPEPEEPPEEEKPPEPEPEAPPLPSVFRDVKPVKKVVPPYPREAEDAHIQGRVKVRMSVGLDGDVTSVEVLLAEPPGVFDEVAVTAAQQFKFKKDGTIYQADEEFVFRIDD
jgi:TonB family protein